MLRLCVILKVHANNLSTEFNWILSHLSFIKRLLQTLEIYSGAVLHEVVHSIIHYVDRSFQRTMVGDRALHGSEVFMAT